MSDYMFHFHLYLSKIQLSELNKSQFALNIFEA